MRWILLILLGSLFLTPNVANGQAKLLSVPFDDAGESQIEVVAIFDKATDTGFAPMLLRMTNGLAKEVTWKFEFKVETNFWAGGFRSVWEFNVGAKSHLEQVVLVPLQSVFYPRPEFAERSISAEITSSEFPMQHLIWNTNSVVSFRYGFSTSFPKSGLDWHTSYDAPMLPADWRAYVGLTALVITDQEWQDLDPAVRAAIHSWLDLGGELHLYTLSSTADLAATGFSKEENMSLMQWDGVSFTREQTMLYNYIDELWSMQQSDAPEATGPKPALQARLDEGASDSGWERSLIALAAVALAICLMTPLLLSPIGRRYRFAISGPLVLTIAGLLLFATFLLRERDIGGVGARMLVIRLDSKNQEAALIQEQFTRTTEVNEQDLKFDAPTFASHTALTGAPNSGVSRYVSNSLALSYVPGQKEHYRGDWFFSRSEQGHHLQQVKSTKARLTDVSGEEGKMIISELGFTIDKLFYRDIHGNWWSFNGDIRMGQRVILQPSNQRSYQAWVATREELSGATARLAFPEALASGTFCAESADPEAGFIETSADIDWKWQRAIIVGEVITTNP